MVEDRIMNSGASFHATYWKEELERFKLRSGKVRLAYDKTLDIASVGDVVLKNSFGTSWTLKDVRYILGQKIRIGMNMLASKGNVPDVQKVDIYFYKLGLCIPEEEWPGKDTSLTQLMVFGCDSFVKLSGYEESPGYPKQRYYICGLDLWSQGSENSGSFEDSRDQMKNTLKIEHPPRREALRLHRYTKSLIHLVKNLKNEEPCSDVHQVGDERKVKVLRSFNWPPSELIMDDGVLPERASSKSRPPMLNKENYVPWSSRLLRYAKSRPNGKLIHNSILNGPYVRKMILEPGDANRDITVTETFHLQTNDELSDKELKQIEADDQAIQTILLGLPEDIYAAIDSCETAQEIWLRVQQMMKGSDIGIEEKKANQSGVDMLPSFIRPRIDIQLITLNYSTTAMNMALALTAKAFKLNYSTPNNNNQRISSNSRNRQIAQPGMNMGQDRQLQMIEGNGRNQFRQYAGQNARNPAG
nr:hypothetical protein [Tanacetum cinerariifolium]